MSTFSTPSHYLLRPLLIAAAVALMTSCGGGSSDGGSGGGIGDAGDGSNGSAVSPLDRSVAFRASNEDFPNPERGMTRALGNLLTVTSSQLQYVVNQGASLAYAPLLLDPWRNSDLPSSALNDLEASLGRVRQAGLKVILRATYGSNDDTSLARIQGHIRQLGPVLARNADVIAYWQAGFIGAYGEWHSSTNDLNTPASHAAVRDALLAILPANRNLQFRRPDDLQRWYPTPANENTTGVQARIGLHNDCFLADDTDKGTYPAGESQRAYIRALSGRTVFGGETCDPSPNLAQARGSCTDILREGRQYHVTYLGETYYTPAFHDQWKAQGCMAEVRRSLGYRFELTAAAHSSSGSAGQNIGLHLDLVNRGWARLTNPRPVELLLRHATTGAITRLALPGVDPRHWLPGQSVRIERDITLPASLASGEYTLYLALPDEDSRLATDPRYAIRPANASTGDGQGWNAELGAFALGSSLSVS